MPGALQDVADRAGVSKSTASRVLNNVDVKITQATRLRVRAAAAEVGYQPNRAARALSRSGMQVLGLWTLNLRSAYSSQIIIAMSEVAISHEVDLMVGKLSFDSNGLIDTLKITACPVDGILMFNTPGSAIRGLDCSLLAGVPVTSMGGTVIEAADHVRIDFQTEILEAVRRLRDAGCARIAYLLPLPVTLSGYSGDTRLCAYEAAMRDIGMPAEVIVTCDDSRDAVIPSLRQYIASNGHPDGLLCFDDNMAIGACRALKDLGLRIPHDVVLIGCDGSGDAVFLDPPFSTIELPVEEMCATACKFLRARIANPSLPMQRATLLPRLSVKGLSVRPGLMSA